MDSNFCNHLQFFRRHRGDFFATDREVFVVSGIPGVTSWTPISADVPIPDAFDAVRLIPPSGEGWGERLAADGFVAAEALSYQELTDRDALAGARAADAEIRRADDAEGGRAFADVQARGFIPRDSPPDDPWYAIFPFVALRNVHDPEQDMLIARSGGEDAAVLLVVHTVGVAGIYAVATAPEHRNKGLSAALLKRAVELADRRGARQIVLQAMVGSNAENFYRRLGFSESYVSQIWRRPGGTA